MHTKNTQAHIKHTKYTNTQSINKRHTNTQTKTQQKPSNKSNMLKSLGTLCFWTDGLSDPMGFLRFNKNTNTSQTNKNAQTHDKFPNHTRTNRYSQKTPMRTNNTHTTHKHAIHKQKTHKYTIKNTTATIKQIKYVKILRDPNVF